MKKKFRGEGEALKAFFMKFCSHAAKFPFHFTVSLSSEYHILLLFFCILSPLYLSACGKDNADVSSEKKEQRFVSVLPSYTEILFDIGAGNEIVGVSDYCDRPEEAKKITKVGNYYTHSAEKIYSLKPDAVFIPESSVYVLGAELEKLNVRVVRIPQEKNIEDIFSTIRILSAETGRKKEGAALISSLKAFVPPEYKGRRKKIYIDVDAGLWTCGGLSYLSDMVRLAGGENVFADVPRNYFQAAWESVLKSEPDFILTISGSFSDFKKRPLAAGLPAIKNKAFAEFDRSQISRPGPSIFPLIKEISKIIRDGGKEIHEKENRKCLKQDCQENTLSH